MKFGETFEVFCWYACYHHPNSTEMVVLSCVSEGLNYYQQLMKILLQLHGTHAVFEDLDGIVTFQKSTLRITVKKTPNQHNKWP